MQLPAAVLSTIRAFALAFPLPRGDGSEGWLDVALRNPPGGWTHRLAEYVCFVHGPAWGHKRRSPSAPLSAGTIAMREGGGMHCFDMLIGTGTGAPVLASGAESDFVTDQMFVPVSPVDHLGAIKPPMNRPAIFTPHWGVTSFDLACKVAAGDRRWIDQVLKPTKLIPRIVVYATVSGNGRTSRDFTTGLAQTGTLLEVMVAEGLRGQFVLLCGTANDGTTRAQALDMIRQEDALFVKHAAAVAGLQIGNENSHGVEASYMVDPSFLAEADALIDSRFAVAWGAGHGGEGVSIAGGSYIVHHADRALTPDQNGAIMGEAQRIAKRPVIDDENLGITEPKRVPGRQRTADPQFAAQQIAAVKKYGYGGSTVHIDAGLTCDVAELEPVQNAVIAMYAAEVSQGHPILDVDLGDEKVWYPIFVGRRREIEAIAVEWYTKSNGHAPADSDIAHAFYWRSLREWKRWGTLRNALENAWPKGAPDT